MKKMNKSQNKTVADIKKAGIETEVRFLIMGMTDIKPKHLADHYAVTMAVIASLYQDKSIKL